MPLIIALRLIYLPTSLIPANLNFDLTGLSILPDKETPDFEPFLPVSKIESEISRIIAEVCHFLYIRLSGNEISNILRSLSYFSVDTDRFLTNFHMPS